VSKKGYRVSRRRWKKEVARGKAARVSSASASDSMNNCRAVFGIIFLFYSVHSHLYSQTHSASGYSRMGE
jgi:hypothetical protein